MTEGTRPRATRGQDSDDQHRCALDQKGKGVGSCWKRTWQEMAISEKSETSLGN